MNPISILKAILVGVACFVIGALLGFGSGWISGDGHGKRVVQAEFDTFRSKQEVLAETQKAQSDAEIARQAKALSDERTDYANQVSVANDRADAFEHSLQNYIRANAHPVPSPAQGPSGPAVAPQGPQGDSVLERLSDDAVKACLSDAAQLQTLIDWENK